MEEKKYLKWYNIVGYGSGDLASNCVNGLLTAFLMIYLTDTVGMNAGIVGTLMMVAKLADGVSDVFFGNLMDRTHTKMGKARPWMLFSQIGNSVFLVATFAVPMNWGETAQYVYFFITYTALGSIFYTANNIAYSTLTSLITKNNNERVLMGSVRFMFSMGTNIVVSSITVGLVGKFGGGAAGWRTVAIIYAIIGLVVNTISVMSVRELPEDEVKAGISDTDSKEDVGFFETFKLLLSNKYFLMIALYYVLMAMQSGITGVGAYYCTYILHNVSLLGAFTASWMLPTIVSLVFTPLIIKRFGIYRVNFLGYVAASIFRIGYIVAGYAMNVPLMVATSALAGLCSGPTMGDLNAITSEAAEYTVRTKGKHIEGAMFSCSSFGMKVGGGVGSALSGILLNLGGYVNAAEVQPESAINMLNFMYLCVPFIMTAMIAVDLYFLKVEKANRDWDAAHGVAKSGE